MFLRVVIGMLTGLLLLLQVQLWVSADGFREVSRLKVLIRQQTDENSRLAERNQRLEAEVVELRKGGGALEERARADLGLIGSDETFYIFGFLRPTG